MDNSLPIMILKNLLINQSIFLLLYVAGIVLAVINRKRLPTVFVYLIIASALGLLVSILAAMSWPLSMYYRMEYAWTEAQIGRFFAIFGIIRQLLHGISLACYVLAALSPVLPVALRFGTDKRGAPAKNWTPPPPPSRM